MQTEVGFGVPRMSKRERVDAAVQGHPVDRPPVAAWRHFVGQESNALDLARAMLSWLRDYDWDFVKVNPRWTYAVEAWGNRYDLNRYEGVSPALFHYVVQSPGDLAKIRELDPSIGPFEEQLEAVSWIVREVNGEAHVVQTVFSPLSYLTRLAGASGAQEGPESGTFRLRELVAADADAVHSALGAIAATLARYVKELLRVGADGVFFADVKFARSGQLTREEYLKFGRPYDMEVMESLRGSIFNVLHLCGEGIYMDLFTDYPVQVVNWDVLGRGNPSLAEGQRVVSCAVAGSTGEAGTLQTGTAEEVTELVHRAVINTGGRRLIVTPGCSVKPPQSEANLRAFRRAVDMFL